MGHNRNYWVTRIDTSSNHTLGSAWEREFQASDRRSKLQPKIPENSVGTSNGTDHFGLVRPEYSGAALKVVHFDRSGHFCRSDRNAPFHLTKLLSTAPLFCILLTRTTTKRAVAWVGSVQPECNVSLGTWNVRKFEPEFLLNWTAKQSVFSQNQ